MTFYKHPYIWLLSLIFSSQVAKSEQNLPVMQLNQCLKSLEGKSDGSSTSLNPGVDSEFLLIQGSMGYILTSTEVYKFSIPKNSPSVILNYFSGNPTQEIYKKISLSKGQLGSISFDEPSKEEKKTAIMGRSANTPEIQKYFSKEISRRIQSMPGEYQNRTQIAEALSTLATCSKLENPEISKKIQDSQKYFSKLNAQKKRQYPSKETSEKGSR